MANRKLSGSQLRSFRSDVARLKAKGLVSDKVDARSQKPTRYMRDLVNKRFAGVLAGKDKVVKAPSRKEASIFDERFDRKGRAIIVPNAKGEKLRYSKKNHEITSRVKQNGVDVQKVYSPKRLTGVEALPTGKGVLYTLKLGKNGGQFSFDTKLGLANFLRSLSDSGWKDAIQYVEVTRGHKFEGDLEDFSDDMDNDGGNEALAELAADARESAPRKPRKKKR